LARRYPLELLRKAIEQVTSIQRRPLMVEYLLLDGSNDTDQALGELIAYLRGLRVHINLIPYNPIAHDAGLTGTTEERRNWFAAALSQAGFTVTVRYSLGADIAAACGQLARLESR
jgi:23S rRNA (adenine2503-C2)-methyltransferase